MQVKARTVFLAFRWRFRTGGGKELELCDNVYLAKVPRAEKHIQVCTGYLDYNLRLPFIDFSQMVLFYYD